MQHAAPPQRPGARRTGVLSITRFLPRPFAGTTYRSSGVRAPRDPRPVPPRFRSRGARGALPDPARRKNARRCRAGVPRRTRPRNCRRPSFTRRRKYASVDAEFTRRNSAPPLRISSDALLKCRAAPDAAPCWNACMAIRWSNRAAGSARDPRTESGRRQTGIAQAAVRCPSAADRFPKSSPADASFAKLRPFPHPAYRPLCPDRPSEPATASIAVSINFTGGSSAYLPRAY